MQEFQAKAGGVEEVAGVMYERQHIRRHLPQLQGKADLPVQAKVNIIGKDNGVGLSVDKAIIEQVLPDCQLNFVDAYTLKGRRSADLNIFLELVEPRAFKLAKANILIPNPEWFHEHYLKSLPVFDAVLAKSKDCYQLFKPLHRNVIYTSFTSPDRYAPGIQRQKAFLHLAGKSEHKGTLEVFKAFEYLPERLFIVTEHFKKLRSKNYVSVHNGRLEYEQIELLQNKCLFHVCTSQYEGFGHYLHEARSCGIVLTTDAAPMNEWVTDKRLLVKTTRTATRCLGTLAYIDPNDLAAKVKALVKLPAAELSAMFWEARTGYLKNDAEARERLRQAITRYI